MMTPFAPKYALCLIDLSPMSSTVLSWAGLFAHHFPIEVEIFHAAWSGGPEKEVSRNDEELFSTELHARLEQLAENTLGTSSYRVAVQDGHPVVLVLERLEKQIPDLIVLGSHGYDGFARSLMGSVAENVVRIAPCPMLVVKGERLAASQTGLRRIVCPVSLSDSSRDGAQLAALCASKTGAELEIVQAVEQDNPDEAAVRLKQWAASNGLDGPRISTRVLAGDPSEQVVSYLRKHAADLVVIGAEQKPFLEYTTLGRTTERVMRHGSSSVLLLPRRFDDGVELSRRS